MIKVNGSPIGWLRYEFGVRYNAADGVVITQLCDSMEHAETLAGDKDGEVMMRGVYCTGWIDTL